MHALLLDIFLISGDEMDVDTFYAVLKELKLSENKTGGEDLIHIVLSVIQSICLSSKTPATFKSCFNNIELEECKFILTQEAEKSLSSHELFDPKNPSHVFISAANYFGVTFVFIPSVKGTQCFL